MAPHTTEILKNSYENNKTTLLNIRFFAIFSWTFSVFWKFLRSSRTTPLSWHKMLFCTSAIGHSSNTICASNRTVRKGALIYKPFMPVCWWRKNQVQGAVGENSFASKKKNGRDKNCSIMISSTRSPITQYFRREVTRQ